MADIVVGSKVTTSKYPGVWEVVEKDDFIARLKKQPQGVIIASVASLTLFEAEDEEALSAGELTVMATAAVRRIATFASPAIGDKMQQMGFTEARLYRDLLAELIAHVNTSGQDVVDIIADAMNLIGAEAENTALYDAAERIKSA